MGLREIKKPIKDPFLELLEDVRSLTSDEWEVERLLTEIVVKGFVKRMWEDFRNEARLRREDHVSKGKRLVRKRAAKVPDSVLQFVQSLTESDECDRASSSRNTKEEAEMHVAAKRRKLLPQASEVNTKPEPGMPEEFRAEIERMNGIGIIFVMEKSLMETDVKKQNNRLSIPRKQIRNEFLSDEEKMLLDDKKGLDVTVLQPCGRTIRLVLKKWVMSNTFCYNLIGGWCKEVVENKANGLETGSVIRLWAFRQGSNLGLCLVKV